MYPRDFPTRTTWKPPPRRKWDTDDVVRIRVPGRERPGCHGPSAHPRPALPHPSPPRGWRTEAAAWKARGMKKTERPECQHPTQPCPGSQPTGTVASGCCFKLMRCGTLHAAEDSESHPIGDGPPMRGAAGHLVGVHRSRELGDPLSAV